MPTEGKVRIVNRDQDRKFFEIQERDAEGRLRQDGHGRIVKKIIALGSTDDRGKEGCAQPEIDMDGAEWDEVCKVKAIRGLVDERKIAVYPLA